MVSGSNKSSDEAGIRFSFVMPVLNGMPFIEYGIRSVYDFAHEIIVAEGSSEAFMFAANSDGSSRDGTLEFLRLFPDPQRKIKLVQGRWSRPADIKNEALRHVTGNWVWFIDAHEAYRREDLDKVRSLVCSDASIAQINFIGEYFWKRLEFVILSRALSEEPSHWRRVYRFEKGAVFDDRRGDTLILPGAGNGISGKRVIGGDQTRAMGIKPHSYLYMRQEQVQQRIELLRRCGFEKTLGIELLKWYQECFLKWNPQNCAEIESRYPVWIGDRNSRTQLYKGVHQALLIEYARKYNPDGLPYPHTHVMQNLSDAIAELRGRFGKVGLKAIETGTLRTYHSTGQSTCVLSEAIGEKGKLISVDINPDAIRISRNFCYDARNVEWVESDSITYLRRLQDGRFHFAFLDSVNNKDVIFDEFCLAAGLMVDGGVVMIDDAGITRDGRSIDADSEAQKGHRVWEFLRDCGAEFEVLKTPNVNGTQLKVVMNVENLRRIRRALAGRVAGHVIEEAKASSPAGETGNGRSEFEGTSQMLESEEGEKDFKSAAANPDSDNQNCLERREKPVGARCAQGAAGRKPVLHFVYSGDPLDDKPIAAPGTKARILFEFFKGNGINVRHYLPDDTKTVPDVADDDVVIGHPHPNRKTIIWRLFQSKCAKKYLLWPFHSRIPQLNRYVKDLASLADKLFIVSGPYWTDTLKRTEYAEWASKIVRVDNAVDGLIFTLRKQRFNQPGRRGLFVFGRSGPEKGAAELFELLKQTDYPVVVAGHYEPNDLKIISGRPNTKILGHIDWLNQEQTKCVFEICDFAISMPVSDASPTTLLESMAGGLVPITTPQCGYYYPSFLLLSLKDTEHNLLTLKRAQFISEEDLKVMQRQNRLLVEQQHNWRKFCDTIWGHISADFNVPGICREQTGKKTKALKVAEDYVNDGMKVDTHSSFGDSIKKLFAGITPQKIIETGTYLGTGTTTIIANALKDLGIRDNVFCTIEVNPEYHAKAKKHFSENNIQVYALNGLSVPRAMLPNRQEIERQTISGVEYDGIFVDHREKNRAEFYYRETDFPNVPDNLLYKCLEIFEFRPDFVLLDSAGHIGSIEFDYLIEHLKGECYIALDDIFHIKHHRDFQKMQSDKRFEIIVQSDEKFGFCIARFNPAGCKLAAEDGRPIRKKVLIVRPDSIGDFILFSDTLRYFKRLYQDVELHLVVQEHIAELVQTCPDVDRCITFNAKKMETQQDYADGIIAQLKEQKYDAAVYPVYSRSSLGDYLTLESQATKKIAVDGDCSNMPPDVKLRNNTGYTRLVPASEGWIPEMRRSEELLRALGIGPDEPVTPKVWLTNDDIEAAQSLLSELKVEEPIVVCPFGQHEIRHWPDYNWAQLLSKYRRYPILICGAKNNRKEAQRIIKMSGHPRIFNLCGKTGLRQMAALLKKAKLCIGVESAAGHIAAAVGCPHVVIIGGGHFGRFMPYSSLSMLVYLPTKCYRCNWLCPRKFKQTYCITQIRVDTVDRALRQAIKKPKNKWTEPVLVEETVNRDFLSQQALEVEPWDVEDVDLNEVEKGGKYLLTAVVSTYKAERHIEGCLENLESQTIAGRLEIIVVDSGSPQNEGEIVKRLQAKYDNIKYIRTQKRETIYKAWNRGIKQACGKYVTNANTDDRMSENALECMVKALEKYPDAALVYCDQDWVDEIGGNVVQEYLTPEFSRLRLLSGDCYISSNPVWRKSLHKEFGYFENDTLCVSGDWEYWLRVSQKYDCMRVKSKFGQRRFAPDCNSVAHTRSRTGLTHLDIAVIYRCYHYANQYGLSVGPCGVSGHKLFSKWPQHRLMTEKTKARFEDRKLYPEDYVLKVQSFNCDTNPRLSIIIVVSPKDGAESQLLPGTVESLSRQSCGDFELIIVDGAGTVHKPAGLAKKFGRPLVWIDLISDFGPSFARNIALDEARGEFVAFIEPGSAAEVDFVRNICCYFEQNKDIYALRGRILPLNEEYACFSPDYDDLGDEAVRTLCEDGANCAFRKADVVETGGFDDDLFAREFVELCYRLFVEKGRWLDGIMYVPAVTVNRDYSSSVEERFLDSIDRQIADMTLIHKWPGPEIHYYMDLMRRPYGQGKIKLDGDVEWMVSLAYTLEEKQPDLSLIWVERAIEAGPFDVMANQLQSSVYLKLNRMADAQKSLEKTIGLIREQLCNKSTGQNQPRYSYMKMYGWCCIKLADCYVKTRQLGKLKTVYEHLLQHRNLEIKGEFREKAGAILAKLNKVPAEPVPGISSDTKPAIVPIESQKSELPISGHKGQYLVSAIVSTYNAQQFFRGCLEDLENQTIADKLEIIVVNSASEEDEESIVREFQKKYSNIVYIKTEKREGLYSAWNRGIRIARGLFLTNANTDDRHRKDAIEIMTDALLANPDIALVYGDQIVTDTPNGTFENHHAVETAKRPEFSRQRLLFGCCTGSQPMWRKSLHDEFGDFDETLTAAADWDFWLKIARKYSFKRIPEFLGLYYRNEQGIEHGRKIHSLYERYIVGRRYGNPYISVIPLYQAGGNPLVSIVMPAYNAEEYISQAIESVLIQNYRNFELIIVDDGSADRTADIVRSFKEESIRYFFKENKGVASARNFGVQKVNGAFVIMLDSDDMMTPDYIARHLQAFEKYPDMDMVYCDELLINEKDKPIRVISRPEYADRKLLISDLFRSGFPVIHFKTFIKRSVFDKIGRYDEGLIVGEDYDMMRRFAKQGLKMLHLPAALYLRRLTASGISRGFSADKAKSHFEVVRRFTETFTPEQLFPDVHWSDLPEERKLLLAKCRTALVYLGIGEQHVASAPDYASVAFELACAELDDCCKIAPADQQVRTLREKCRVVQSRQLKSSRLAVSQPV